ncbi:MAG: ABC transporter ATP-binding protein [Lachnospiraceae bacterium]|nr:ABC transporter ATP-binding protein [Lachnospiraceae bacterium]
MRLMLKYMSPYRLRITITIFLKFAAVIFELLIPYILETMIDVAAPAEDVERICVYGVIMVFCAVAAFWLNITANRMATKTARDAIRAVRGDLFSKTMYLCGDDFDDVTLPSLISRMTSDSYNVQNFLGMIQRMGVRAPIILAGGIAVACSMDMGLTLILVCMVPVLLSVIIFISKKGIPLFRRVQGKVDHVVRVMRENISGIRVIKALSMTEYEKERFGRANDMLTDEDIHAGEIMALPNPVMNLFLNLGLTCVILVGAYRVDAGVMKTGVILAFLTYFNIIIMAVMGVNRIFISYSKAGASADRIQEVLECGDSFGQKENEISGAVEPEKGHDSDYMIEFEDVSIDKMGLKGVSFKVRRGGTLGIIGATGCGKTTVLNLMMRFYDVDAGRVLIDGTDVRNMGLKDLRSRFGVVFQNDMIFNDTLYENISFGRNLAVSEVRRAADDAGIAGFIEGLEEKYNYMAAIKGMNLSGGQRQRILIARALAGDPDIIVLDDASSALDYRTDAGIRARLLAEYKGVVKIVIAQRVSSVMNMDNIIVMDEGKIIGSGTHEALLAECELYRGLFKLQMGEVQG